MGGGGGGGGMKGKKKRIKEERKAVQYNGRDKLKRVTAYCGAYV